MNIHHLNVEISVASKVAMALRLWADGEANKPTKRPLSLGAVEPLLKQAEKDYYTLGDTELEVLGRALYKWLDGDKRFLARALAKVPSGCQAVMLSLTVERRLAHLPWELLHDGHSYLLFGTPHPVLPVRRVRSQTGTPDPRNRDLGVLFLAASVEGRAALDFEREESLVLKAAKDNSALFLTVEESGNLEELGKVLTWHGAEAFDLVHLIGHATHRNGQAVFCFENVDGTEQPGTAEDIAKALPYRPPLLFLSACRTARNPALGEECSLAEQLVNRGFPAVIGWGRHLRDGKEKMAEKETQAAAKLYGDLAAGVPLTVALLRMYQELRHQHVRNWHLLRLFCAGDPPGALVTAPSAQGRAQRSAPQAEAEFLDPLTKVVKVAGRAKFVGRRRLLQNALRTLKEPGQGRVGLLLWGQGGRGKSSIAARLCDRLQATHRRVVVFGELSEPSLVEALCDSLPDDKLEAVTPIRKTLRDHSTPLADRIAYFIAQLAKLGLHKALFVLDDFEQNQPDAESGELGLSPESAESLQSLFDAIQPPRQGRVLITGRYRLPETFVRHLEDIDVVPLDERDQRKQNQRLDQQRPPQNRDPGLLDEAYKAADGNPRLFEWLHGVLEDPGMDHAAILSAMNARDQDFREDVLAQQLVDSLDSPVRLLLGRLLLMTSPVPRDVVVALAPEMASSKLDSALLRAASLSLLDTYLEGGQTLYRTPRQLSRGANPPISPPPPSEQAQWAALALDRLYPPWWSDTAARTEGRLGDLVELARLSGRTEVVTEVGRTLSSAWLSDHRVRETAVLLERVLNASGRNPMLLLNLALAIFTLGEGERAGQLLEEAESTCPADCRRDRADILFYRSKWLAQRGFSSNALSILRDELVPLYKALDDERALLETQGQIANILQEHGQSEDALRILEEYLLPAYARLGYRREQAITLGKIADILHAGGQLDKALNILKKEVLPVFEDLTDVRESATTFSKIANILQDLGQLDDALRIREEEVLPVFERLGDVREHAITLGKNADILHASGLPKEALRIRNEKMLPVFERLGDVRQRAATLRRIADTLQSDGRKDEALRIRKEEQLRIYEHLVDARSWADTLSKISKIIGNR